MTPVFIPMPVVTGAGPTTPEGAFVMLGVIASMFMFAAGGALVRAFRAHVLKRRMGFWESYFDYIMYGLIAWVGMLGVGAVSAFFYFLPRFI